MLRIETLSWFMESRLTIAGMCLRVNADIYENFSVGEHSQNKWWTYFSWWSGLLIILSGFTTITALQWDWKLMGRISKSCWKIGMWRVVRWIFSHTLPHKVLNKNVEVIYMWVSLRGDISWRFIRKLNIENEIVCCIHQCQCWILIEVKKLT